MTFNLKPNVQIKTLEEIRQKCNNLPIVVSYGSGTNSTALLIALKLKNISIAEIVFCDTGNESEDTYKFLNSPELEKIAGHITTIRYELKGKKRPRHSVALQIPKRLVTPTTLQTNFIGWGLTLHLFRQNYQYQNLGEESLVKGTMPSKTFGKGDCSLKWKVEVFNKYVKSKYPEGCIVCVGIHSGEINRVIGKNGLKHPQQENNNWKAYPLIDWGLTQEHCEALLRFYNLKVAKSACWFCPMAKPSEVLQLPEELYELGVSMEQLANAHHARKGLGKGYYWSDLKNLPLDDPQFIQLELFAETRQCSCTD